MTDEEVSQVQLHPTLAAMVTDDWSPYNFPLNVQRLAESLWPPLRLVAIRQLLSMLSLNSCRI